VTPITFFVPGKPVPQGSKRGFVAGSRAVVVDVNPESLGAWRSAVALAAAEAAAGKTISGAIEVSATFYLKQPLSVKRAYPSVRPDVDKLLRSLLDGLTGSGIWHDDSQVVDVFLRERYGDRPGADISVRGME
jgi:Holliday junction resolvase RusA-like endonuclease